MEQRVVIKGEMTGSKIHFRGSDHKSKRGDNYFLKLYKKIKRKSGK